MVTVQRTMTETNIKLYKTTQCQAGRPGRPEKIRILSSQISSDNYKNLFFYIIIQFSKKRE